ncbi:MAG: aspartyl protease family protein [Candidatus Acidiferrum sp.]|jgi:tetratricopeptide (TPR) repeat protein
MRLLAKFATALVLAAVPLLGVRSVPRETQVAAAPAREPGTPRQTNSSPSTLASSSLPSSSAAAAAAKPQSRQQMSTTLLQAQALYRCGEFAPATAAYYTIIHAAGPDRAWAYAGMARVYLKQNDLANAFTAAQKAVALDGHLAAAHSALGEVYFRQGKFDLAEHEFHVPVNEKILDARAFLGLSRIYRATSNYKLARTAIHNAHLVDPADPEIQLAWLETLDLNERIPAIEAYLAGPHNDAEDALDDLRKSLIVLQDEAIHPARHCQLKTPLKSTQTDLLPLLDDPTHARGYALKVKFNNTSAKLLLDTGAGGIVVNGSTARKAGIARVAAQKIGGIGDAGAAEGYVGFVDALQIGELQFENCYVDVLGKKGSLGEEGLIGADLFANYLVEINFPDKKLQLSELPKHPDEAGEDTTLDSDAAVAHRPVDRYIAPEMQRYSRVFRFEHMLLISTSVNDHPFKMFLIDTGAFDNMITPDAARETTKIYGDDLIIKGLSGKVRKVYETGEVTLTFGHLKQNRSIAAFDLSSVSNSAGTEISGTLGFAMLALLDIKIDYRDGLVDFSYDPHRFH